LSSTQKLRDRVSGRANQAGNFLEATFGTPHIIERRSGDESAIVNREEDGDGRYASSNGQLTNTDRPNGVARR
jgi:hypothetical protein